MIFKNVINKDTPSLLSKGAVIDGNITNAGNLEVEGEIKGNISTEILTLRENGIIVGDVCCKVFNIKGLFNGNASAEKINISDTAKITGILEYKFLSVDYGAEINCQLKRTTENNLKD